ncbi:hypothetical protein ACFWDI_28420 [Streptomyces sp. NPDC060064]|uniref:hypothetical protein n=1 Tax=Streptomyces sp. NPDC060064 TaxID=3347049 RepID=UPI003680E78F
MPGIRTVTDVVTELFGSDAVPVWRVRSTDAAGNIHEHVFPHVTLAWRAAEYGIDPADTATLLDIILHEPLLPDLEDPDEAAKDPAARVGMTVPARRANGRVRVGDPEPVRLHNAVTIADARTAHLMRIAEAKKQTRIDAPSGRQNPLKPVLDTVVDPAQVSDFAVRVDQTRRRIKGERIPRNPQPDTPIDDAAQRRTREMKEAHRA